jgi:hypothetical protein
VQLAVGSDLSGQVMREGSRKFMAAGVAVVGACLIAANPLAPNVAADIEHRVAADVQHRAVQLTSGGSDVVGGYEDLFNTTANNLQTLVGQAGVAYPTLLKQIGTNLQGTGNLIGTALQGAQTGMSNSIYGGWYGGDDGYVFGLLGGTVTHAGVTKSGSTLQEILGSLSQGNAFNAFGYFDEWALETVDHTSKPLLSPFLNEAKTGMPPTTTLFNSFGQATQNVFNTLLTYANLKNVANGLLSPPLSVIFGLLFDGGKIGGDLAALNFGGALADMAKAPADIAGDLINGFVYPGQFNPTGAPFAGLINNGSLLQQLLVTWPEQLAQALGAPTSAAATGGAAASLTGGLAHVTSLLPNLAQLGAQPSLMLANLGANLGATLSPMFANIAAQLATALAPNMISAFLMHLPALILAML